MKANNIFTTILFGLCFYWVLLFASFAANAGPLDKVDEVMDSFDIRLEVGKTVIGSVDEDGELDYGNRLVLGWNNFPVYIWGESAEMSRFKILGQGTTINTELQSVGIGVDYEVVRNVTVFVEGGVSQLDYSISDFVQEEVAYTYLVGEHYVPGRPIPVRNDNCVRTDYHNCFTSTIEYDSPIPLFRVGVSFEPVNRVKVYAAYKYQRTERYVAIWDEDRKAAGTGWWESRDQQDLSAIEAGIMLKW